MNNQENLTKELIEASKAYYTGNPIMSDLEFDKKLEELRAIEQESGIIYSGSPTHNVGAEIVTELKKARHEQPALSLDKVKYKDRKNLIKWLGNKQAVMSWKCDGSTVVVTYDNGKLTSAVTRGNGEEGSVITHNARFFKGLPTQITYNGHLVVRGEAMMANAEFERVNAEAGGIYENARNLATATIQMLDANESRKREIIFKAFEVVTPEPGDYYCYDGVRSDGYLGDAFVMQFMQDRLDWLEALGFDVVDRECCDASNILQKIEEWKEDVQNLPYPTDGLVISYNDLEEGWALGSTGHHPRWAMALKWTDETVETTIRNIEWSIGKTGVITPVAIFDEVRLGLGSNVTRASLHNISIMEKLGVKKNCKAEVYLANLIIPQVASCEGGNEEFDIPDVCPICGAHTRLLVDMESDVDTLHCDNAQCPAQQVGKLMNTFSKGGLFVKGLGESQIIDLLEEGLVTTDPLSFYQMANEDRANSVYPKKSEFAAKVSKLWAKDGWGKKKWENLIDAINASRKTTLQKFLYSLNIPLLGNDLSKKLAKFWNDDIEEFKSFVKSFIGLYAGDCRRDDIAYAEGTYEAAYRTLSSIDGVGPEKAKNVIDWVDEVTAYRERYEDFVALIDELKFPEAAPTSTDNSLEGLTFVITGSVHEYKNRDEFKASVEARSGKVAGSVSAKTSFLVNNDVESTSGKNQKAKELSIPIISEDEFIAKFGR